MNDGGLDYSVDLDATRFRADSFWTGQPNADREFVHAQLSRPVLRPWGFFTPKVQLHASHYQFDRPLADGRTAAGRVLPTLSLDSGLVFERDARYFGRAFTQTLEPRLKYVYTPYRDQNGLPNYDSGLYDFNFATIWADNIFAGNDRIVDNNLITAGLTSRLLDPQTGAEALRLSVAQRYRFTRSRWCCPAARRRTRACRTRCWAPASPGTRTGPSTRWCSTTARPTAPRAPRCRRAIRRARSAPSARPTACSATWPTSRSTWAGSGPGRRPGRARRTGHHAPGRRQLQRALVQRRALNYSMNDRRLIEGLLGFEYDAGCWIGRVVLEKVNSSLTSSTKRIMFQLELVGLSRLGSSPLRSLRNSIPHYQLLRQETTSPSRFTDYE
jgi:LPS-assembly protein